MDGFEINVVPSMFVMQALLQEPQTFGTYLILFPTYGGETLQTTFLVAKRCVFITTICPIHSLKPPTPQDVPHILPLGIRASLTY